VIFSETTKSSAREETEKGLIMGRDSRCNARQKNKKGLYHSTTLPHFLLLAAADAAL
jgi:hypothetical protein